jgi:hypothetical protein
LSFFCNPMHITRIVVAYQPGASKVEELKTVYQHHLQYIQSRGLPYSLVKLFDHDLSKQIKEWRDKGKRILLVIDINDHPSCNKFYSKLIENNSEIDEFMHKCWGPKEPYTRHAGKSTIDGGYKTPEVELVNFSMLHFAESPGDHRSFLIDFKQGRSLACTDTRSAGWSAADWIHPRRDQQNGITRWYSNNLKYTTSKSS